MTPSIITAAFWVLAATATAMLPMKHQYKPGITLLVAAPFLIIWLGYENGWWLSALATLAFLSMFRHPLRYLLAKARGQQPERPK